MVQDLLSFWVLEGLYLPLLSGAILCWTSSILFVQRPSFIHGPLPPSGLHSLLTVDLRDFITYACLNGHSSYFQMDNTLIICVFVISGLVLQHILHMGLHCNLIGSRLWCRRQSHTWYAHLCSGTQVGYFWVAWLIWIWWFGPRKPRASREDPS